MPANPKLYDSERMAYAYAFTRPPIHVHVCQRIIAHIPPGLVIHRALDVGCGAGASTAALSGVACHVVGVDPFPAMLRHAAIVAQTRRLVWGVRRAYRLRRQRLIWSLLPDH
ncbi:MAG: methyltransferase domain-containing protein [Gammaproteobacteria bacterium]